VGKQFLPHRLFLRKRKRIRVSNSGLDWERCTAVSIAESFLFRNAEEQKHWEEYRTVGSRVDLTPSSRTTAFQKSQLRRDEFSAIQRSFERHFQEDQGEAARDRGPGIRPPGRDRLSRQNSNFLARVATPALEPEATDNRLPMS
jgi:hypothetical protein